MERTSARPLPRGVVNPFSAIVFGVFLLAVSFLLLSLFVNLISAVLAMGAAFSYVVLYTFLLKRKTPVATEVGGISGALPPVIGYAAVTGTVDLKALTLFLIMFMWQPPHFWVLALKYRDDYAKAGVPALPVARGVEITKIKTLLYTVSLLPLSLIPYMIGMAGRLYLGVAVASSILYAGLTLKSMRLFFFSIVYIAVLFTVLIVDLVKDESLVSALCAFHRKRRVLCPSGCSCADAGGFGLRSPPAFLPLVDRSRRSRPYNRISLLSLLPLAQVFW